jgi:hypothetical protein
MQSDFDHLLRALKDAPIDHALDELAADIGQQLAERRVAGAQTWGLRASAAAFVTMTGVALGASGGASAAAEESSPFAVWSELAPSTLLGGSQ